MASLPPRRSLDLSHITWRKCVVDQSDHSGTRQSLHAPTAMSCAGVLTDEDDEPFSHGRASPARLAQRPGHAPGLRKSIDGQDQLTRSHIEAAHHPAGTGTADEATEDGNEASAPTDAGPHRAQPPLDGRCKP